MTLARDRGQEERIGELNPAQRGGEPLEIANAALFLASDEVELRQRHGAGRRRRPVEQPPNRPAASTYGCLIRSFLINQLPADCDATRFHVRLASVSVVREFAARNVWRLASRRVHSRSIGCGLTSSRVSWRTAISIRAGFHCPIAASGRPSFIIIRPLAFILAHSSRSPGLSTYAATEAPFDRRVDTIWSGCLILVGGTVADRPE